MDAIALEVPGTGGLAAAEAPRPELLPAVVAAAAAGDPAALKVVVRALRPVIHASVAGVLRSGASRAEVEDLVQEVFVQLLEDGSRRLRSWDPSRGTQYIKTMTRNLVLSHLRGKAKRLLWREAVSLDDLEREPEAGADPEGDALRNQHWDAILAGLHAALSEHEHRIFLLLLDGIAPREICRRTGTKTENAVHMVRRRVIEKAGEIAERLHRTPGTEEDGDAGDSFDPPAAYKV